MLWRGANYRGMTYALRPADMNSQRLVLIIAALVLSACHSNLYTTPRTVPAGKSSHIVALHAEPYPGMVYIGRVGIADRVDMGLHATYYFNKLDVKVNFLRTKYFDMAVNPAVSYGYEPVVDDLRLKASLPIMLGLNVSPDVTFMFQGGPVLMRYRDSNFYAPTEEPITVIGAIGGGIQIRVHDYVYLQPEVGINYFDYQPIAGTRYWPNFGIAVGFGPQPQYDDSKEKSK